MLAYVAAALALVMIVRKVFRLFAVRRLRRRRLALREQWNQDMRDASGRAGSGIADMVAAPGPAQHRRKLVAVPRIAEIARPAADEWDPDHDIEALDVEESLQQFLPPRWRHVAA